MTPMQKNQTAVLLAQSCVGEAGFNSVANNECGAIAHIYLKLSKQKQRPLRVVIWQYSAALKTHKRKWIRHLNTRGKRPKFWPKNLRWKPLYRRKWKRVLTYCKKFVAGQVPDPLPNAIHYGGKMDIPVKGWIRIKTRLALKMNNYFYKRRRK